MSHLKKLKWCIHLLTPGSNKYRGYRLIATSVLPLGRDTLVYGSADGAVTMHVDNPQMNGELSLFSIPPFFLKNKFEPLFIYLLVGISKPS